MDTIRGFCHTAGRFFDWLDERCNIALASVSRRRCPLSDVVPVACVAPRAVLVRAHDLDEVDEAPPPSAGSSVRREAVQDFHLAEFISQLAKLWERTSKGDRAALAVASVLDLVGAEDGAARGRTVEALPWWVDREAEPTDPTASA